MAAGRGYNLREFADGRVFTGRQAKEYGLVDELGGMQKAVAWLADDLDLEGKPTLVYPDKSYNSLLDFLIEGSVDQLQTSLQKINAPSFEYRYDGPH